MKDQQWFPGALAELAGETVWIWELEKPIELQRFVCSEPGADVMSVRIDGNEELVVRCSAGDMQARSHLWAPIRKRAKKTIEVTLRGQYRALVSVGWFAT